MPTQDEISGFVEKVNSLRYQKSQKTGDPYFEVTDDEIAQVKRWSDGQELQPIYNHPGYQIIFDKLHQYMEESVSRLINTDPTNSEIVLATHAVAYAHSQVFFRLQADVNADLEAAKTVPELVKQGYKLTKGVPPESA